MNTQAHQTDPAAPYPLLPGLTPEQMTDAINWLMDATECGSNESDEAGSRLLLALAKLTADTELAAEVQDALDFIQAGENPTIAPADHSNDNPHADGTTGENCDECASCDRSYSDRFDCESCGKPTPYCHGTDGSGLCDFCWTGTKAGEPFREEPHA